MSETHYDRMMEIIKSMLPKIEKLPDNFYRSKKLVDELGLEYKQIHACPNDCTLYYDKDEDKTMCPICNHQRYKTKKARNSKRKDVPYKILRYFPIIPRLQRLYMLDKIARHMRWHMEDVRCDLNLVTHPSDAEAWKKFDVSHSDFASEIRNVRLGLSTDGFNPFGNSSVPVTCWLVFITPYNLPPSMCMKRTSIFLTLVIPGPNSPKKHLDVYLRPLVDELKILWDEGVFTFDAYKKQNFLMRASLLWTISDFSAYGMLSGWSTQGRIACPICMERTKSFYLKNGSKCCWFDCHRQFLPMDHRFRRNKNDFKKGIVEKSPPPLRLSGSEIISHMPGPIATYKSYPQDVKDSLFDSFMRRFRFAYEYDRSMARIVWEKTAQERFNQLLHNARNMARTHKRKTREFVSQHSQNVSEGYSGRVVEKYGEDGSSSSIEPVIDMDAWLCSTGQLKKGRVYGFGRTLDPCYSRSSSSASVSSHPASSSSSALVSEEHFLSIMRTEMRTELRT
ncbi:Transposon protein, putative, CACTA, En/Spm sub-class [Quillaja saponaria]|uniref:Transposon protein, putative, CACTA, En/Spm sub-class n=1 Tax=Quillaja saponaria TaxID=32244 RepID=A0AAD7LBM9_QUISA|nr:Transposon protein, putative, CACTA, En/Spm sub-class [Quillaja saponaria]